MLQSQVEYVRKCIADNNMHRFYTWKTWVHTRASVLETDRHECQDCKRKGRYTKANVVHHVNYVKTHPELALEVWYTYRGIKKRNLVSLCHDCHEARHGYRIGYHKKKPQLTEERWD